MRIGPQRPANPDAIVAPQGYRVEALVTGLTFPSAISFGSGGELYLAEAGGVAGSLVAPPRVIRIDPDRSVTEIGRLDYPITGLVYRQGELFIGEDAPSPRILRVTAEGEVRVLVEGLPGGGDYGLSGLSLDASGGLLFGLGTRTNSGVVGLDNTARGWVAQHPDWADVPGADVQMTGVNYVTSLPSAGGAARVATGSFKPFGHRCDPGETVRGSQRAGGAVFRVSLESSQLERLAWGLRYPVGVCAGPNGQIYATEGGMEERGSRPVSGAPDNLWEIRAGGYYGWPDHVSGLPVTDPRFRLPGHPQPRRLLENAPAVTGLPAATFAPRSGVGRFDFSTSEAFGFQGEAFVALSGEWSLPAFAGDDAAPAGFRVVRVDPQTGRAIDFLINRQGSPASVGNTGGLERPFEVRFDPSGEILYVVDLGEVRLTRERGLEPFGGTGIVWRITRARTIVQAPPAEAGRQRPERRRGGQRGREQAAPPVEEAADAEGEEPTPVGEEPETGLPADETAGETTPEETAAEEPGAELLPGIEPAPEPPAEAEAHAAGPLTHPGPHSRWTDHEPPVTDVIPDPLADPDAESGGGGVEAGSERVDAVGTATGAGEAGASPIEHETAAPEAGQPQPE